MIPIRSISEEIFVRHLILSVMVLTSQSADAQIPEKFDLLCEGDKGWIGSDPFLEGRTPVKFTLHVNLPMAQYCRNSCENILEIEDSNDRQILFSNKDFDHKNRLMEAVDRSTGEYFYHRHWSDGPGMFTVVAKCAPQKFTPFPAVAQRF